MSKQERMTAEQFRREVNRRDTKTKFKNKKTVVDGITFDSKLEANRYCELKMLMRSCEIQGFARQPSFILDESGRRYRPDFIVCGKDGQLWVEDTKGYATESFKSKQRQWERIYPWLPLVVVK